MTTSAPGADSMTSRICAVDGFIDWPPADDVVHAERVEDAADPVAGGDGDDRGHRGGPSGHRSADAPDSSALANPGLLLDLVEQVGDTDVAGPAGVEGGLDRGADVVGVDVAVPQAVASDDHDRVADAGPDVLEGRERVVGRLEEVHDLVAQVRQLAVDPLAGSVRQSASGRPSRHR